GGGGRLLGVERAGEERRGGEEKESHARSVTGAGVASHPMPSLPPVSGAAPRRYDIAVIGAGAAGMMCAATAGQRGRRVVLVDHYPKVGEKIRISGGGRCNFTNLH